MALRIAVAAVYLALMTAWVYAIGNRTGFASYDWLVWFVLVAQPIVGLLVGRWWVALLPFVVAVISVPAGFPAITPESAEPFPIWFSLALASLIAVPLVAAGVVARRIYEWQAAAAIT